METNQIFISKDLSDFIRKYREDEFLELYSKSSIADALCGIENTISGMHVDDRTEALLKEAMGVISSYHWLLSLISDRD